MLGTFIKIITFPIWFPLKVLWVASKVLALVILTVILCLGVYFLFFMK